MKKVLLLAITFALAGAFLLQASASALTINYNNVISDQVFDNYQSMSASQINTFLNRFPNSCISPKNGYSFTNPTGYSINPTTHKGSFSYGSNVSAGTVISNVAQAYHINPQVLLTTMQKEEGMVRGDGPYGCSALAFSATMGYNCTDSGTASHDYTGVQMYVKNGVAVNSVNNTCVASKSYVGFSRQVTNAAWLLTFARHRSEGQNTWYAHYQAGWDNSDDLGFCYSGPMTQGTHAVCPSGSAAYYDGYSTIDGTAVHMDNGATASLYFYTPHKHGQLLFFNTFAGWFGPPSLKDEYRFEGLAGKTHSTLTTNSTSLGDYTKTLANGKYIYTFYYDATNKNLRFAQYNGSRWSNHVLDGPGASGSGVTTHDVGKGITATVYQGEVQVYYYDATNGSLRHTWMKDGAWHRQTLDGTTSSLGKSNANVGQNPTFLIYHDQLQIYYYDATSGNLRHAWWPGGRWHFETMDGTASSLGGHNANIGLSTAAMVWNDQLQLYYYDATSGNLRHAWWPGGRWHFETMDGSSVSLGKLNSDVGKSISLTIYGNNQPQIYYYDATSGNLRHAWWPGGRWHFQTIDGNSGSVFGNNANVGSRVVVKPFQNDLFLFYYDITNSAWRVAYWDKAWHSYSLDGGDASISGSSEPVSGELSTTVYNSKSLQIFYKNSAGGLAHSWVNR